MNDSEVIISKEEVGRIREFDKSLETSPAFSANLTLDKHSSSQFKSFAEAFSKLCPTAEVKINETRSTGLPWFGVGTRLRFHMIPLGNKLSPFLKALAPAESPAATSADGDTGAELTLFVSGQCPYCPAALENLLPLTGGEDRAGLRVVDALLFPNEAEKHAVQSLPTLILDGNLRWTGIVSRNEIRAAISPHGPGDMDAEAFERLLNAGNSDRLTEMMKVEGRVFPSFVSLLAHEKWPIRLGAMVVLEELMESAPFVSWSAAPHMWALYHDSEKAIRGDLLYIFGELGDKENISSLGLLLEEESDPEIREMIMEALDRINEKSMEPAAKHDGSASSKTD